MLLLQLLLLVKNDGKHSPVFSPETSGNGLSVSSFHTIKVLESVIQRSWQRLEPGVEMVPVVLFLLKTGGGEAWKSLSGAESNI